MIQLSDSCIITRALIMHCNGHAAFTKHARAPNSTYVQSVEQPNPTGNVVWTLSNELQVRAECCDRSMSVVFIDIDRHHRTLTSFRSP